MRMCQGGKHDFWCSKRFFATMTLSVGNNSHLQAIFRQIQCLSSRDGVSLPIAHSMRIANTGRETRPGQPELAIGAVAEAGNVFLSKYGPDMMMLPWGATEVLRKRRAPYTENRLVGGVAVASPTRLAQWLLRRTAFTYERCVTTFASPVKIQAPIGT
jgi:hypothetical protein